MSTPNKNKYASSLTLLADSIAIIAGYILAYLLRFHSGLLVMQGTPPDFKHYANALGVVLPVFLWIFRAHGLYAGRRHIRRIEEIFQVLKATSYSIVLLMGITFIYRGFSYSRIYLVVFWITAFLLVSISRYSLIQIEYWRKKNRKDLTRILLIGAEMNARQIIQWSKANPHYGQDIVGILTRDLDLVGKHLEEVSILGTIKDFDKLLEQIKPDQVVLTDSSVPREQITEFVVSCEDQLIPFKVVADVYGLMTRHVDVEYVSSVPLLGFRVMPLDDLWNRFIKRSFDFVVSLVFLTASIPIFIGAWILIKLDDRGPFFYYQERVGRDFKTFRLIKFRTMRVNAESESGPVWAKASDNRKTRFGKFMRAWNIDELPQLINVLKGDMSLVGPRPERPHFVDQFRESIPRYMARHKIKSGLTGWAAVNGFRGNTSIHERVKYDLYYMENWSLLFDIEIIFMTFSAKAFKNAY